MSDTKTKTIVALYGRVSTEQQVQHGDSLAAQRDTLTHWAQSMSWEVFDLYIDQGITGGISEKPNRVRRRVGTAYRRARPGAADRGE